jgi:hypothetical protein
VVLTLVTPVGACSDVAPSPAPTPRVAIDAARPRTPYWTDWLARYVAVDTTVPPGHEADALPILTEALTELGLSPTSTTWGDRRANVWATLEAPAAHAPAGAPSSCCTTSMWCPPSARAGPPIPSAPLARTAASMGAARRT